MSFDNSLDVRKHIRLKTRDYSLPGAYFITICTDGRRKILSGIKKCYDNERRSRTPVIELTTYGEIAEKELLMLPQRFMNIRIGRYVIMPNHIHFILVIKKESDSMVTQSELFEVKTAGASPRPTVMDIVCAYKSLTTRECKKYRPIPKLFQTSFHEHIIRNKQEYLEISDYILNNPILWQNDKYYI